MEPKELSGGAGTCILQGSVVKLRLFCCQLLHGRKLIRNFVAELKGRIAAGPRNIGYMLNDKFER